MITNQNKGIQDRASERGNVLFLILIAVALFAALSYAVTQSTRSGGGDASRETTLVNSSTITQYPASIKTAIVRMLISNGITVDQLIFDPPSAFGSLTATQLTQNVFSTTGGGATYAMAPNSVMENSASAGTWTYNAQNQILNIGSDGNGGNDVIAFLSGVSASICDRIHSQLGMGAVPAESSAIVFTPEKLAADPSIPSAAGPVIGAAAGVESVLNGQPQGCFTQGGQYHYYHVVVER
jgi:hypothetical protein